MLTGIAKDKTYNRISSAGLVADVRTRWRESKSTHLVPTSLVQEDTEAYSMDSGIPPDSQI